jgi:phosphoserine aminotransferase
MPSRDETSYFGAGPAPLPTEILTAAGSALLNYNDMGVGVAEMSHRSPEANAIISSAKAAMSSLLSIPDDYEILWLQGGGSGEFSAVVYHMVSVWVEKQRVALEKEWSARDGEDEKATAGRKMEVLRALVKKHLRLDYLVTGSWSLKASQEAARLVGSEHVHIITDARKHNGGKFGVIPAPSAWNVKGTQASEQVDGTSAELRVQTPALTYFCDNETVDGVEFPAFPTELEAKGGEDERMIIADMSSNFLSRRVDVKRYSVIFGGAQKNIGIPGVTIVIIRKSLLAPQANMASADLLRALNLPVGPIVLDYSTAAKNGSLYNTLPIFDVWIAGQVMERLLKIHGEKGMLGQEEVANKKARMVYDTLEKYGKVYKVVPDKAVRSRMNICLRISGGDADVEKAFITGAAEQGLLGLKGHRSVGGIRVSNCKS